MQLKLTTDYSIRVLVFLAGARFGTVSPASVIAAATGISPGYLSKVVRDLRLAGLIRSEQGTFGGFSLARPPQEITLLEVLAAAEDTMKINRCLEPDHLCSRGAAPQCKVHQCLGVLQEQIEDYLKHVTISDLL